MRIVLVIVGITLCASRSISVRNNGGAVGGAGPECARYCGEGARHCVLPPVTCGACLEGYVEKDGLCLPLQRHSPPDIPPDTDSDALLFSPDADVDEAANRANHVTDDHREAADISSSKTRQEPGENYVDTGQDHNQTTSTPEPLPTAHGQQGAAGHPGAHHPVTDVSGPVFVAVVAGCSVAGLVGLVVAGVCWYKLQKNAKAASEVEYPAYGVTGPAPDKPASPGDRKLAQSAQMYHYQHQKQQMIAMEKAQGEMNKVGSEVDSEEENEDGDYTVFECPGLAPTGEMEVKNPLFTEDTPTTDP